MAELAQKEIEFIVIGGETDAPGIKIVSDGHGGIKIVHVPGWNPEQLVELGAALKVIAAAAAIHREDAQHEILHAAIGLAGRELDGVAGEHGAGTVVVVAG
jgi:hypothetical protein